MKLTNNERIALNMIALNDYQQSNGSRPESFDETTPVWSNCLDCNSSTEQLRGRTLSATCASLAKKGLVETYDDTRKRGRTRRVAGNLFSTQPDESTIALTRAGYDAWLAAWPEDK
jgi:hypothetical protein